MRAAFGACNRVNLIDNDSVHAGERRTRFRGEHQIQRLGRGNQNIGWMRNERPAFFSGGIARTHTNGYLRGSVAVLFCCLRDADQWRSQVAFHVHTQCFKGRDVENLRSFACCARCAI